MFFLSLKTSTVAFRTVLDELLCFFLALNLTSFQYFCQESFFFAFLFAFQRKFGPKIPAKIPRNRPFSLRICLFKSREISLFFPRIIRSPDPNTLLIPQIRQLTTSHATADKRTHAHLTETAFNHQSSTKQPLNATTITLLKRTSD